jgi:RNA polymerase sigma-70 factor (ECF subfamily)
MDDITSLEQPHAESPDPERLAESAHIERSVAAAMSELTPLERAAFTLRHYEGRSIAEIGKTLGLGASATKHSVFRAVRKLRTALEPLRGES